MKNDDVYQIKADNRKDLFTKLSDSVTRTIEFDPKRYQTKVNIIWGGTWCELDMLMEEYSKLGFYNIRSLIGGNIYELDWSEDLKINERRKKKK